MTEQAASNPYIFGDAEQDRVRLETQSRLVTGYLSRHAHDFTSGPVQRILDIGCGEGQLGMALMAAYPGAKLVGVDRDEKAIQKAKAQALSHKLNAEFIVGDVQQGLPSGPFDLIFVSFLLMHSTVPQQILNDSFAQLRASGTIWIIEPVSDLPQRIADADMSSLVSLMNAALSRMQANPDIMDKLPGLLQNAGFTHVSSHATAEDHPFAASNEQEESLALAAGIGAMYNAREGIARATGTPVAEIEQKVIRLMNRFNNHNWLNPRPPTAGVITARKP